MSAESSTAMTRSFLGRWLSRAAQIEPEEMQPVVTAFLLFFACLEVILPFDRCVKPSVRFWVQSESLICLW